MCTHSVVGGGRERRAPSPMGDPVLWGGGGHDMCTHLHGALGHLRGTLMTCTPNPMGALWFGGDMTRAPNPMGPHTHTACGGRSVRPAPQGPRGLGGDTHDTCTHSRGTLCSWGRGGTRAPGPTGTLWFGRGDMTPASSLIGPCALGKDITRAPSLMGARRVWGGTHGLGGVADPLLARGLSQLTSTCLAPSWWTWSRGRWTACARVPLATFSALTTSSSVGPRGGGRHHPRPQTPPGPLPSPGRSAGASPPAPWGLAQPARRQTSAVSTSHPTPASDLADAAAGSACSLPGVGAGLPAAIGCLFFPPGRAEWGWEQLGQGTLHGGGRAGGLGAGRGAEGV